MADCIMLSGAISRAPSVRTGAAPDSAASGSRAARHSALAAAQPCLHGRMARSTLRLVIGVPHVSWFRLQRAQSIRRNKVGAARHSRGRRRRKAGSSRCCSWPLSRRPTAARRPCMCLLPSQTDSCRRPADAGRPVSGYAHRGMHWPGQGATEEARSSSPAAGKEGT